MRARGITYDTGFASGGRSSRPDFDSAAVRREMRIIADEFHCDAVRITGGDVERLATPAGIAAEAGLEVWFSPFPCELDAAELLPFLIECADRAEAADAAVFVTGCELSLFNAVFLPGSCRNGLSVPWPRRTVGDGDHRIRPGGRGSARSGGRLAGSRRGFATPY